MSRPLCPDEDALFALVDAASEQPHDAGPVAAHVAGCAACTEKKHRFEELLSDLRAPLASFPVESFVERLQEEVAKEPPVQAPAARPRSRWILAVEVCGAALAIAAMVVLVPRFVLRPDDGAFTPRSGVAAVGARRDVDVSLDVVTRSAGGRTTLAPARAEVVVAPGAHLLLSYATRSAVAAAHLLCFAVDAKGEVHWLYPAFEDAASDPASVVLPPGRATTAMGTEAVLEGFAPGPLHVHALVSARSLHVSDVERLPPGERTAAALTARFPDVDVRSWDLRVESRPEGGTP